MSVSTSTGMASIPSIVEAWTRTSMRETSLAVGQDLDHGRFGEEREQSMWRLRGQEREGEGAEAVPVIERKEPGCIPGESRLLPGGAKKHLLQSDPRRAPVPAGGQT